MASLEDTLRNSVWARALAPEEFAAVRSETSERALPAGGYVCRKDEPVTHWIGVIEGLVKLSTVSREGKSATLTGVPAGGWFGEGSLLKDEPRRYDAIALRDTKVALMPRSTFSRLLGTNIAFNRFLLEQLNERLSQFIAMLENERLLDTESRVARCIGWLFNPLLYPGLGRDVEVSQEELGYLCGISRQRANQALRALESEGLLRVEYGRLVILELERLRTR